MATKNEEINLKKTKGANLLKKNINSPQKKLYMFKKKIVHFVW